MLKQPPAVIPAFGGSVRAIGKKTAARLRDAALVDEAVNYISSESARYC
jgi:hypothetical protein